MSASEALIALVPTVALRTIRFRQLSAYDKRATDIDVEVVPVFGLSVATNSDDPTLFRLGLRCEIKFTDEAQIVAEVEAEYQVDGEGVALPLAQALMIEYMNEVAVMALIPYLRHAIADLSLRVFGSPITMPVFQRGAISFPLDMQV